MRSYIGAPGGAIADAAAASNDGSTSYAAWICGGSPILTEFISSIGFDAVVIEYALQYHE